MLDMSSINKVELEITSDCNAACPGCARTQNLDILKIESFSYEDLQRIFPTKESIEGKKFKFCGVLGDPIVHKEFLQMVIYLSYNGGMVQISTNGAYQTANFWKELGRCSKDTNRLSVSFAIDGFEETNHIYRVNTVWSVLKRNLEAYSKAGGKGDWIYIVFDHNEHELEAAKEYAKQLGFKFATRTGMRNSFHDWIAKLKKKDQVVEKVITTTGKKQHSKVEQVKKIDKFIEDYSVKNVDKKEKDAIISSVKCKLLHEGEIFISADLRLWPCCFLWDEYFKNKDSIVDKLSAYGDTWNSLKYHSIEEILQHEYYQEVLDLSWNPDHKMHLKRCLRACGLNQAYQNEFNFE